MRLVTWATEQKIKSVIPLHGGTIDFYCLLADKKDLVCHIVDLKTGSWKVKAQGNEQCLAYAGLVLERHPAISKFVIHIYQPRCTACEPWTVSADDVRAFQARIGQVDMDSDLLQAGDWCNFCRARDTCPELDRVTLEVAHEDFGMFKEEDPVDEDVQRWTKLYEMRRVIQAKLEALPKMILAAMEMGKEVPGYKAVQKYGQRKWVNDDVEAHASALKEFGVPKDMAFDLKAKSPKQMEDEGFKDEVELLWYRPARGLEPARTDDPREEVNVSLDEFDDINEVL